MLEELSKLRPLNKQMLRVFPTTDTYRITVGPLVTEHVKALRSFWSILYMSWQNSFLAILHDDDTHNFPIQAYLSPCAWARLLSQDGQEAEGILRIKLLCSGHDEREILYLCILILLYSGRDNAESDRNWSMCQGDLLPPPSLYTVPHSTVKMWMQVHKKCGEYNVKDCCSQKIYNLLLLTLKQWDYLPQLI